MSAASHAAMDQASAWVTRFAPLIPDGEVLDLACGGGRHARALAAHGHTVLAVDRDPMALECARGQRIETLQADLEGGNGEEAVWPFEDDRFAGIVVTNYLHRPLFPHILRSLAPGGLLIYETFAEGNEQFGKPSNPAFLLLPGELLTLSERHANGSARVIAFEDGYVDIPKPAMVQRICLLKNGPGAKPEQLHLH
jgi:SAM-dependent methyltransferase